LGRACQLGERLADDGREFEGMARANGDEDASASARASITKVTVRRQSIKQVLV